MKDALTTWGQLFTGRVYKVRDGVSQPSESVPLVEGAGVVRFDSGACRKHHPEQDFLDKFLEGLSK